MAHRWRSIGAAVTITVVVDGLVRWLQTVLVADMHPAPGEIRSIADLLLAAAFGIALYLWLDLRATRAALTEAERSQVILDTQLTLAADVQRRSLPPPPDAIQSPSMRWAIAIHPAWKIGGDFYDFIATADGGTFALVGDVSGTGIPAALLQSSAHALFRGYARRSSDPAELLRLVSREIFGYNGGALHLTCLVIRVDRSSKLLRYVNAGHPPGVVIGRLGRRLLDKGGLPVGLFADTFYETGTVPIESGDVGVLVTDGITEALEPDGRPAIEALVSAASTVQQPPTADRVCDAIMTLAEAGPGPRGLADWDDDKTVVVFEVEPEPAIASALTRMTA